jgi:hypothetical protein
MSAENPPVHYLGPTGPQAHLAARVPPEIFVVPLACAEPAAAARDRSERKSSVADGRLVPTEPDRRSGRKRLPPSLFALGLSVPPRQRYGPDRVRWRARAGRRGRNCRPGARCDRFDLWRQPSVSNGERWWPRECGGRGVLTPRIPRPERAVRPYGCIVHRPTTGKSPGIPKRLTGSLGSQLLEPLRLRIHWPMLGRRTPDSQWRDRR